MNDSALSLADARALVSSALWPAVRTFLWDFASLCDPARLAAAGGWGGAALRSLDPLSSSRVARAAERALGLSAFFHPFPASDGSRLLLLSRESYDRLALFLGALALAPALRRVAIGAEVRVLKAALPGVYPEVFGYTAYFPQGDFQRRGAETQSLPESVAALGCAILLAALANLPASLVSRLTFKLPKTLCASAALREKKDTVTLSAILKLLKLKFPEAYSLCCS